MFFLSKHNDLERGQSAGCPEVFSVFRAGITDFCGNIPSKMSKPFYITTAIDYVNGQPHLGHAYEKIIADVIARTRRSLGQEVFFLTGLDEHGQKVQQAALAEKKSPRPIVITGGGLESLRPKAGADQ